MANALEGLIRADIDVPGRLAVATAQQCRIARHWQRRVGLARIAEQLSRSRVEVVGRDLRLRDRAIGVASLRHRRRGWTHARRRGARRTTGCECGEDE